MAIFEGLENTITGSIDRIILIIGILLITFFLAKIISRILQKSFNNSSSVLKVDPTKYRFIKYLVTAIIYILGLSVAIYMIPSLRNLAVSLLAGAGVIAIILGFAAQQAISNIISGVFIVIFKPFRLGDRIDIGSSTGMIGIVEDITLRHTVIRNFENKRIIIPNSIISNETIENSTIGDEKICKWVNMSISYDSDVKKAKKIMAEEALKHPLHIDNRRDENKSKGIPVVGVRVVGYGDSSVNLRAYVWTENPLNSWILGCDLNESIKERFDKEGIEIPFPYRTLVFKDEKKKSRPSKKSGRKR